MPKKKKAEKEEVYHVEVITKARVNEDGDWEYFVKWAGYDSDADSWEPSCNVQQCDRLLSSFWKHIGMDDKDYPIGYEAAAGEDWINKEKRYYLDTFVKPPKQKSNQATKKKSGSSVSDASEDSTDGSPSSDEEPSLVPKRPSRKARTVGTESESESDDRLRKQVKVVSRTTAIAPPRKEKVPATVKRPEIPQATGSSLSIAPPKVSAMRTHQDQRTNPLVKSLTLPSQSVEAGSSLSTKQRVAAGIPPPPTGPKPLLPPPKKPLPSLSFRKNKPSIPTGSQSRDTATSSASIFTPVSPVVQTTDINDAADVVASPQPMDVDPVDFFDSTMDDAGPPGGSSAVFAIPVQPKSRGQIDAEMFLQTIDIPELSGPLDVAVIPDKSDQPTSDMTKTLAISKIPKKWKWSGDLFISTSEETVLLCAVSIADPNGSRNSSYINLLLSPLDSLRISKLYPVMDLSPLLRACGKPQYFGRLEPNEPSEEVSIHGLEHHLTSEGLAAAIPLFLDGAETALLVVFPGSQQGLAKVLQVPEYLLSGTPLLVVLLPLVISAMTAANVTGWKPTKTMTQSPFDSQTELGSHELLQEVTLHQEMFLLCFPKVLQDFFNSPTARAYCIWPSLDHSSPGLDVTMLQHILKTTKAVPAKLEGNVRVIFISNRHLEMLHTMPFLVEKRANSPETQFWTFGYSANMACEKWRFQEIYPLGGIVTFTASALAEDLVGCHQLMSQIIEHPLWECYLLPEVLALSHLLCNDGDMCSSSKSYLEPIFDFINLGLISVTKMPEKSHSGQQAWISQMVNYSTVSGHELLEINLEDLRAMSMTTKQLITNSNNEVAKDLSNAQLQPAFMEGYRRFVVIRAASEDTIPFNKDGLEWSSLSQFSFKDDYFQS